MSAPEQVVEVAADLAERLERHGIAYMVIDGLANLVWGTPRLTRDVDATVQIAEGELPELLAALAPSFRPRIRDAEEFARESRVLLLEHESGVPVDAALATLRYDEQALARAVAVPLGTRQVRVCTAEDLILHKILSDRPRDREDVQGIVRRVGARLERGYLDPLVRGLAEDLGEPEIWEFFQSCFDQ